MAGVGCCRLELHIPSSGWRSGWESWRSTVHEGQGHCQPPQPRPNHFPINSRHKGSWGGCLWSSPPTQDPVTLLQLRGDRTKPESTAMVKITWSTTLLESCPYLLVQAKWASPGAVPASQQGKEGNSLEKISPLQSSALISQAPEDLEGLQKAKKLNLWLWHIR